MTRRNAMKCAGKKQRRREREGGTSPPSLRRLEACGRMFWPAAAANRRRGAAPSAGAGSARESTCTNLRSVFSGRPSLLSALLSPLMVVQTFRMKIQEPPVSCDAGRVGGGDPDGDKPSCEDVPRLDLTALTEENNWGGRASGGCFHPRATHVSRTRWTNFVPRRVRVRTKSVKQEPAPAHGCPGSCCALPAAPPLRAPRSASRTGFNLKRSS